MEWVKSAYRDAKQIVLDQTDAERAVEEVLALTPALTPVLVVVLALATLLHLGILHNNSYNTAQWLELRIFKYIGYSVIQCLQQSAAVKTQCNSSSSIHDCNSKR